MKSILLNTFPTILRPNRKKAEFEKYMPVLTLVLIVLYFLYGAFMIQADYRLAAVDALKKAMMFYSAFLLMVELSPDSQNIYRNSALAIGLSLIVPTETSVIASFYFLFMTRILTKGSGYLTTVGELIFITLYTMLLFTLSGFLYPLVLAITLILDYRFKHRDNRNLPFIALNLAVGLLWLKNPFGIMTRNLDLFGGLTVFCVSIMYIFRLSILKNVLSFNDIGNNIISPRRIKAAGILMVLSLIILAIGYGQLYRFLHLWTMLLCITLPYMKDLKNLFEKQKTL